MSLKLAKNNTPVYDYISEGDGTDPVSVSATVTGAGGTVDSSVVDLYLVATIYNYTGIAMALVSEDATKINWKLSADAGVTWKDSLTSTDLPDMNATAADQTKAIKVKAVITNDGTANQPATGTYTTPDIQVAATENPA